MGMAHECNELPGRLSKEKDAAFLSLLASVADLVQAVKAKAVGEQWGHEQMIKQMDQILASAAVQS